MSEKYIRKLITFKNDVVLIIPKPFWDKLKNVKHKVDVILSAEELEILDNLSMKNASLYLKYRYATNN